MIRNAILSFILGAVAYVSIELVFRGHSHISMALAGGICMLILQLMFSAKKFSLFGKCLMSMAVITAVEFIFGLIVNLWLKLDVWSYADRPLNIMGQICPLFSCCWFMMGIPISIASDFIASI